MTLTGNSTEGFPPEGIFDVECNIQVKLTISVMEGFTEIMIMELWQKQPNLCWEWAISEFVKALSLKVAISYPNQMADK